MSLIFISWGTVLIGYRERDHQAGNAKCLDLIFLFLLPDGVSPCGVTLNHKVEYLGIGIGRGGK